MRCCCYSVDKVIASIEWTEFVEFKELPNSNRLSLKVKEIAH